jgi:hypothetical protein
MSEEKIIQHSANALHSLQQKEKSWAKKLKEFFGEILIIVFAVSITLLLHNWNDERREHHMEREFLAGIKSDLDSAAADIKENIQDFQPNIDYYFKIRQQLATHKIDPAYLDSNSYRLGHTHYLVFDAGRFEGFKSSGYLRLIENKTLLKNLMSLYTVEIPFQVEADASTYRNRQQYYDEHIGPKGTFIQNVQGDYQLLASKLADDPAFNYYIIHWAGLLNERKNQRQGLIQDMKDMSAEIAAELKK